MGEFFNFTNFVMPARFKVRAGGEKLHKLTDAMGARTPDDFYRALVSQRSEPVMLGVGRRELPTALDDQMPRQLGFVERMMYWDTISYLTSDILCKVDRASMATSLEARVPYLANDVVRFAWNLPIETKMHNGVGKWPLRQLLQRYVPRELFERPKAGFGIPISEWLRGPLRNWAEQLLDEERLRRAGYFDPGLVGRLWQEHLTGRRNVQQTIWNVLMFEQWRESWMC
jgi:asparagine synthase (glutamine-hydrolysing)